MLFKILFFTTLFSRNSAIKQYHKTYVSRSPKHYHQEQNMGIDKERTIDFKAITDHLKNSIPATTFGIAFASWSICKNVRPKKINQGVGQSKAHVEDVSIKLSEANTEANIEAKTETSTGRHANSKSEEPLTEEDVIKCQKDWSNAIVIISSSYLQGGDFVDIAAKTAGDLYGYEHLEVLFKPTKATNHPFRATGDEAMSYFVGADNFVNSDRFKGEDLGFAINGGKGWKKVIFKNHKIYLDGKTALAMGSYEFTCATTGEVTTAEFTFGYKRCPDGTPRIFLHHSSVPYKNLHLPVTRKQETEPESTTESTTQSTTQSSKMFQSDGHSTHIHIHTTK